MNILISIKEAVAEYKNGCNGRSNAPLGKIILKSIMAGFFIALGAAGSSVAAHNVANVGLARFVAGLVFPVGLMMVISLGAELFTGDCLFVMALPEKKISPMQFVKMLITVWLGNLVGGFLLSLLVYLSGQFNYTNGLLGAYTIKVALGKATISPLTAISSGILCNVLVCIAVIMAVCAKDMTGKLLVSFFIIMLFVTSGFEHCVANMYYITAGLFAKLNPAYVSAAIENYGYTAEEIAKLNIGNMFLTNLLPVTIGSIIGGSVFVGLPLYFLNKDEANK